MSFLNRFRKPKAEPVKIAVPIDAKLDDEFSTFTHNLLDIDQYRKEKGSRSAEITTVETKPWELINVKILGTKLYAYDDTENQYGERAINLNNEIQKIINLYSNYKGEYLQYLYPNGDIYQSISSEMQNKQYPNLRVVNILTKDLKSGHTILDSFKLYTSNSDYTALQFTSISGPFTSLAGTKYY
jgi:hypothetical protein